MLLTRIRTALVLLMVLGLVGTGAGLFTWQPWAAAEQQGPAPGGAAAGAQKQKDRPLEQAAGGAYGAQRLKDLLKKRRDAAQVSFESTRKRVLGTQALLDDAFYAASFRLLEAELDLCKSRADRVKASEAHLTNMEEARQFGRARVAAGLMLVADGAVAEYYYLDAEIRLEREKAK